MHIARVGRHSARVRLGLAALYAVLVAGAVTTLYPFLLMVSTASKSQSDYNDYAPSSLVPRYWRDERALYVKYLEDRYANNLDDLKAAHDDAPVAKLPDTPLPEPVPARLVDHWDAFVADLPTDDLKAGFGEHENAPALLLLRFRERLRDAFDGDIGRLNAAWTEENLSFDTVTPPFERTTARAWTPDTARPKIRFWLDFKKTLPRAWLIPQPADSLWRRYLREDVYEEQVERLAADWKTPIADWREITLPARAPRGPARADWEAFVRTKLPLRMLSIGDTAAPVWDAFLKRHRKPLRPLPPRLPADGPQRTDWMEFVAHDAPVEALRVHSPEILWRERLAADFGTVARANAAFGTAWRSFDDARPPQAASDLRQVRAHAPAMRIDFATRNFRAVAGYLVVNGRAALNTVLFCAFSILTALIVNPMCAYALSRYPLPYAYKVLLFLLATMAFPAEVAMIPNFLMLRDLGMLNTFWALILPGLASGYSIFLLKGFFDSLPRELYEAAILDGATEMTMFRRITAPLSLPIFSVIALNAFTGAYGAFLFALVVCQDPRMWTLMVTLYNLQATAPQYLIMAALTLAALPTLVVFLLAQKVILRGIVLPSFK